MVENLQKITPKEDESKLEKEFYNNVLMVLIKNEFKITTTEAVLLKKIVRNVYIDEPNARGEYFKNTGEVSMSSTTDKLLETLSRFFLEYYGVDFLGYINFTKGEYRKDAIKDFFIYVQEKLRKDRELI